jgi:hypothetical protein
MSLVLISNLLILNIVAKVRFIPASGDMRGLPTDEDHENYKWIGGEIYFSVTCRGLSLNCHVASSRKSLRMLGDAIDEFRVFLFDRFEWCRMIVCIVKRPSIVRLCVKRGFQIVAVSDGHTYIARRR